MAAGSGKRPSEQMREDTRIINDAMERVVDSRYGAWNTASRGMVQNFERERVREARFDLVNELNDRLQRLEMEETLAALQGDPMPDLQNTFTSTGNDPGSLEGGFSENPGALTHELLLEAYRLLDEVDARAAQRIRYQHQHDWGRIMERPFAGEDSVSMQIRTAYIRDLGIWMGVPDQLFHNPRTDEEIVSEAIDSAHPMNLAQEVKEDPYENESFAEWQKRSLEDIRAKRAAHG